MTLPTTLLLSYQAEYERNQDMTIEDLCEKYDVQPKQLKGYTKWQKRQAETLEVITQPKVGYQVEKPSVLKPKEETLDNIEEFKQLAIKHAVHFIKEDAQFAEVKEFKDMVAIVDSIEKSYRDTKDTSGTTINIAIQTLVEKFRDDC
jgi:uncharacterized protein YicC (UPF0701 family)